MSNARRAWIATLIALVVLMLVIVTMPPYTIEPRGVVLPTESHQRPYFGNINIYEASTVPDSAKTVGKISLLYHTRKDTYVEQQTVIAAARQMVANAGGNALFIQQMGHTYPGTPSAMAVIILRGSVLKTP